jgi:capsular polysaccharide biosynthesis protein
MTNITQRTFSSLLGSNYNSFDGWVSINGSPLNYEISKVDQEVSKNINEFSSEVVLINSNQDSVLLALDPSFYHFITESVHFVAEMYEKNPNTLFIINCGNLLHPNSPNVRFAKNFIDLLDKKNVNYLVVNLYHQKLIVKDIKIHKHMSYNKNFCNKIYDFLNEFIDNKDRKPYKKVYVSRKSTPFKNDIVYHLNKSDGVDEMYFNHDKRIDDENKLEEYFKSIGFEIVDPINFDTLKEQINYFYDVKILVSMTGSGLTNSIFMQKEQTVVELVTSMVTRQMHDGKKNIVEESIHNFFVNLSFDKEHYHYAISNVYRNCDILIDKLENIKKILVDENNVY